MNRTSCNHRPAPVIAGILPVLLILVSGCLSSPSRNRIGEIGFEPPGQWSVPGVSAEALTQPWWMGLGSTNLANLVAEALAHNPDLEIAAARLGAAEAEARIAGADLTPSLGGHAGWRSGQTELHRTPHHREQRRRPEHTVQQLRRFPDLELGT